MLADFFGQISILISILSKTLKIVFYLLYFILIIFYLYIYSYFSSVFIKCSYIVFFNRFKFINIFYCFTNR